MFARSLCRTFSPDQRAGRLNPEPRKPTVVVFFLGMIPGKYETCSSAALGSAARRRKTSPRIDPNISMWRIIIHSSIPTAWARRGDITCQVGALRLTHTPEYMYTLGSGMHFFVSLRTCSGNQGLLLYGGMFLGMVASPPRQLPCGMPLEPNSSKERRPIRQGFTQPFE